MDFYQFENQDGIRMSWNNIPSTKVSAAKAVIPITAIYTPMKDSENLGLVEYDPLRCKCQAIINPFCQVDYRTKAWMCQFCNTRNNFPQHYAEYINEKVQPAEIMPQYSTIEYLSKNDLLPNVFTFLIDTCVNSTEELEAIKSSIQQSLNIIPPNSYVGLITFGKFVFVHELGYEQCPKSYAFNGSKDYTSQSIQEQLGIASRNDPRGPGQSKAVFQKFLVPLQECEFTLNSILDDLQIDPFLVPPDERQQRATGTALNVTLSLLEASGLAGQRVMMFLGGPCTLGQGQVVDIKLQMTLRSFHDLQKENDNCKYFKKAQKYYQSLTQRAIKSSIIIDTFAFSLDQFGLLEMRTLSEKTGGYLIVNEEYNSNIFRETYSKIFERDSNGDLKMGFAAKTDLLVSKDLKICGAIGPCQSLKNKSPMASETEIGQGGTNSWFLGGIDRCTSIAVYLDLTAAQNNQLNKPTQNKIAYMQFQTIYKHSNGLYRLRVSTICRKFADDNNLYELVQGFDQEAGCLSMARLGVLKTETEEPVEVLKWLDRSLIRLMCRFAEFKKDEPSSFRLSKELALFPQFIYHLRRSHFIQVFGISPDECTFYRSTLLRENTTNSLVMIQPALLSYSFDSEQPIPVQLDMDSLKNNVILLLDTYFHVVVWLGKQIKAWKDANYHEQPEYENFKVLLQAPYEDVKLIMEDRFPSPIMIDTWSGHTKERYLKSKVNPSSSSNENNDSGNYLTDDASLKVFMDHLIKLVVQSAN